MAERAALRVEGGSRVVGRDIADTFVMRRERAGCTSIAACGERRRGSFGVSARKTRAILVLLPCRSTPPSSRRAGCRGRPTSALAPDADGFVVPNRIEGLGVDRGAWIVGVQQHPAPEHYEAVAAGALKCAGSPDCERGTSTLPWHASGAVPNCPGCASRSIGWRRRRSQTYTHIRYRSCPRLCGPKEGYR